MFGLPPPTKPDDQRSRTVKDALAEGCHGEAVKRARRVLSRVPPIIAQGSTSRCRFHCLSWI